MSHLPARGIQTAIREANVKTYIRVYSACMGQNIAQVRAPLAERVSAAKLPPPAERARIRRESGASLRDFGLELGVSPMTVARWEAGRVKPRLEQRAAYARLLREVAAATEPSADNAEPESAEV